ncbi:hypothetical protein V8C37DRAFT_413654 [Trichoderma ceciliae]
MISPCLPSSPSSCRTITPPDSLIPAHRLSSSGTVQVASAAATSVTVGSRAESSAWSSVSRPSRTSGTISTAYQQHQQQQYQHQHYVLGGGIPPAGRAPFWWMGASASDLPGHGRDGDDEEEEHLLLSYTRRREREAKMQWVLHSVMHGVVLVLQSGVAFVVLSVFASILVWRGDEGGLNDDLKGTKSSSRLGRIPFLTTTFVLILSSTTLLIHEIYLLSAVVLLYLQAAILALTTVSATYMWMSCVQEDNLMLKCVLISCSVLFWGTSGLAFLRAAVVWKVTSLCEGEDTQGRRGE